MRKYLFFSIFLLLGVSLFVWIYKQFDLENILLRFKFLNWRQITALFLLTLYRFFVWAIRWRLILRSMGFKDLRFKTLLSARLGEYSLSYLTPGIYYGGEIVRVLAIRNKVPLTKSIASVVLDRIIEIASFGVFAFLGVLLLFFKGKFFVSFVFLGLTLLPLILIYLVLRLLKSDKIICLIKFFRLDRLSKKNSLISNVQTARQQIIGFFHCSPKIIFQSILLSCSCFFAGAIQIVIFIKFLGENALFFDGVLIRILNLFSGLIPIPAVLGVFEGANIVGFQMLSLSAETGLSFTLMMRLIDFSFVALGLSIIIYYFTYHVFRFFKKKK